MCIRDRTPADIIRELDLRKPIYRKLAAYGHMGREDLGVKLENTCLLYTSHRLLLRRYLTV